jgi:signal transduction histidine kinase
MTRADRPDPALRLLADEQAALRRVATLVAGQATPADVFAAVTTEVRQMLDVPMVGMWRDDGEHRVTVVGAAGNHPFRVGSQWPLDGPTVAAMVLKTGRPTRIDDYASLSGSIADAVRNSGVRSAVGVPILVDGRVWGIMSAASMDAHALPADTEQRLSRFTGLVATAISNAQARADLQSLADEQSALRRVATFVAQRAEPAALFDMVAEETGRVLEATSVNLCQFTPDGYNLTMAGWSLRDTHIPTGTRLPLEGDIINVRVRDTRAPARIDSYEGAAGDLAALIRQRGIRSEVGSPVVVEGSLWGALIAGWDTTEPSAPGTEVRLARFAELVATAIASAQARSEVRALLDEQAALRRVATLVANRAPSTEVFAAVAEETGRLLGAELTDLWRFVDDDAEFVSSWSSGEPVSFPARFALDGVSISRLVRDTGAPARLDDYVAARAVDPGSVTTTFDRLGVTAAVGTPVIVDGRTWGVMGACRMAGPPFPAGTERRLASFTNLMATAISNTEHDTELVRSRARLVSTADEVRRRIERDLHDGIQQRLVSIALDLRVTQRHLADRDVADAAQLEKTIQDLDEAVDDVREISRGVHPALLSEAGLPGALRALARRSALPVELDVELAERPAPPVEIAAYYVAAEAIANATKHARASAVWVTAAKSPGWLTITVRDDGVGGAAAGSGSGLVGLGDRVAAVGGRLEIASPRGSGTTIRATLPIAP